MPRTKTRKPATRAASARKGMRLSGTWLPDMNSPAFIAQARRDSLAIAGSAERLDWMDPVPILPQLPEYGGIF